MYNIDTNVESPKASGPMPAGINQNCRLLGVFFEALRQDGTGGNVLKFNFEDAAGRKFRHIEFEVDVERTRNSAKQWGKDPEKAVANALMGLSGRIKHILSCFLPTDKVVISGNTWDEFGGNVVTLLGDAYKGVDVRLKVILNAKDYTTFPKQAFRPFIQRMDVPDTLAIDAKYERTEPKNSGGTSSSGLDALLDSPAPTSTGSDFDLNTTTPATKPGGFTPNTDFATSGPTTPAPTPDLAPWDEGYVPPAENTTNTNPLGTGTSDDDLVF